MRQGRPLAKKMIGQLFFQSETDPKLLLKQTCVNKSQDEVFDKDDDPLVF